jgi:hypothetical protein
MEAASFTEKVIGLLIPPSMYEPGGPASEGAKVTPDVDEVRTMPG